ncbi:MAG: YIP1 family protein [Gammaproteobacteria bacterium]
MNDQDERPEEGAAPETEHQFQADPDVPEMSGSPAGFDFGDLIEDAKRVITDPSGFYRNMPTTGGLQRPLIFIIVMAVALALVSTVLSLFGWGPLGAVAVGLGSIIGLPIAAIFGSFIGAAILYVIWTLMGSEQGYQTAYRCVAYTGAIFPITGLLGVIPYLGSAIGIAWGMYLLVIASIEVHGRTAKLSYRVFGILGALMILGNITSEYQSRRVAEQFEGLGTSIEEQLEGMEDMSPEEAGQALGEFLRGLEEGISEQTPDEE